MDLDDQSTPSFLIDHDDENSTPPLIRNTHESSTTQKQGDSTNDNNSAGTIDHEFDYSSSDDHSNVETDDEGSLDLDNGTATRSETEGPDAESTMRVTYNAQSSANLLLNWKKRMEPLRLFTYML
jgi:hypothetical protein